MTQVGGSQHVRRGGLSASRRREICNVRHASRPDLRVERVLLAPSGIYVIATTARQVPRQRGAGETAAAQVADLDRVRAATQVVSALLQPRYRARVRSVLCRPEALAADEVGGVLVTSPDTLEHVVQHAPVVLSTSEVHEAALRLSALTEPFPVERPVTPRPRWRLRAFLAGLVVAASAATVAVLEQEGIVSVPLW